jgi:glycosyltransferase involved in cell wall biosynthesis
VSEAFLTPSGVKPKTGTPLMETEDAHEPARWFPPERGPVVVIGNAGSVFPRHLASLWRSMGLDARIVTRRWHGDRLLADGTPIIVTIETEGRARRTAHDLVEGAAWMVESSVVSLQEARFRNAMGSETTYRPSLSPCFADALGLSRCINQMRPQFVCGQEVFAYGLATALSRAVPRFLMPWGGDVYMYAETSSLAFAAVRYALTHVDLVVPGSALAAQYLSERFGVPLHHMHCGGLWALDRARFQRANEARRIGICEQYGIDPGALVVMNVRRFFPAWGSDMALNAFVRFGHECPSAHFVMLGGAGTEGFVAAARQLLTGEKLSERFTILDGDRPLEDCAALMSIADVCVSLMRERDMRPFASILEAVSCGAVPVLGDQPEYRAMEQLGFQSTLCPPGDESAVVEALRQYAASPALRVAIAKRNLEYLNIHEDGRAQAISLLRRVRDICDVYEGRRTTRRPVLKD